MTEYKAGLIVVIRARGASVWAERAIANLGVALVVIP